MEHKKTQTAALITGSIDLTAIDKSKVVNTKNGKSYLNITLNIQNKSNYGNNCWITQSQTKEEQDNKVKKISLGNAAVKWLNAEVPVTVAERNEVTNQQQNYDRYSS
jgi:hypothetical protein